LNASRLAISLEGEQRKIFSCAVYFAEFTEGKDISDKATLAEILKKLGHNPEANFTKASEQLVKDKLRTETEEAQRLGIFGAPNFVTSDGELFWGNDRLEQALVWAQKK
jgi:2-hydroxychromene-2-carboxylate isomerase